MIFNDNLENLKGISGIYKITNLINLKVYIGQAIDLYKRYKSHMSSRKCRKFPLYNSFNKHGIQNFDFQVIEIITDITLLDKSETNWISFYKSADRYYGYNLKSDARTLRGFKFTEESKNRMSDSRKKFIENNPETKIQYSEIAKKVFNRKDIREKAVKGLRKYFETNQGNTAGKVLTEEHKRKVSIALSGRKKTKEQIDKMIKTKLENGTFEKMNKKIERIDIKNGKVATFVSLSQASALSNIPRSTIHLTLTNKTNKNGEKYLAGGFDWKYL